MAAIAASSRIASFEELDLFRLPQTQGVVERIQYIEKYTTTTDPNSSILDFYIAESGQDFINLAKSQLEIKAKIVKDGTPPKQGDPVPKVPPALADEVGPVNLLLQSLFSQVDMWMNNTRVSSTTSNYAYQAYIPTTLSYGITFKETCLSSQLYAKDEGVMDSTVPSSGDNRGLQERATYTEGGSLVHLKGPLYTDVWQMQRWLIPGVNIKLSFRRNPDKFILMAKQPTKNFSLEIVEAKLNVCYCTLFRPASEAIEAALSLSEAKYPLTRTIVKNYSITREEHGKVFENVFAEQIPTKVVIGFLSDEAYNGSWNKNPFNFKHYNVSFVSVYYNGIPMPKRAYEPVWNGAKKKNSAYIDAYDSLFEFDNRKESKQSIDVERGDFCNGYSLFVFNLDQMAGRHILPLYKSGNLRIEIKFKDKLPHGIQMIVYGQFPYILSIDKRRQIMLE